jgi:predicted nuclease of predicted toxin-antitoxin system
MTQPPRCMLLIDADNVSADVIQQAIDTVMARHGAIHVRRAYCTAEAAVTHAKLFKSLSIRPIVNLSAGKNSNDIALAVDAIDLAIAERPAVVVIVSSDSDFAPLVIRLREKGCRVEGLGQLGKTGEEAPVAYDHFEDLAHHKAAKGPVRRGAQRPVVEVPSTDKVAVEKVRAPRAAAPRGRAKPAAPAPTPVAARPPEPMQPADVVSILHVVPALRSGERLQLNSTVEPLRNAGLLSKSAASTKLFKKYPDWFELTPEKQPNKVQYRVR